VNGQLYNIRTTDSPYDDAMAVGSIRLHTRRDLDHVFDLTEIQDEHWLHKDSLATRPSSLPRAYKQISSSRTPNNTTQSNRAEPVDLAVVKSAANGTAAVGRVKLFRVSIQSPRRGSLRESRRALAPFTPLGIGEFESGWLFRCRLQNLPTCPRTPFVASSRFLSYTSLLC